MPRRVRGLVLRVLRRNRACGTVITEAKISRDAIKEMTESGKVYEVGESVRGRRGGCPRRLVRR